MYVLYVELSFRAVLLLNTIAYPLFRKRNTKFRSIYLLALYIFIPHISSSDPFLL